jgi:prepilin-type N-terminal cleavage/methylation domain-containing protein
VRKGFTLLEVMIAIMILVLGIIAVLPLFAVGSASHKRALDQVHTSLLAPRIAAMIEENLVDANPRDVKEGLFWEYGQEYRYDATFEQIVAGSANDPLANAAFILRVTVKWKKGTQDHLETFETLVLRRVPR